MKKVFSVYPQNLAYYNEGYLVGGWIKLPQPTEKIKEFLKSVVKLDEYHEEYEIADIDDVPFPYSSIQWASLEDINSLAIVYSTLDEFQKEAIQAHLEYGCEENYSINELINICLQIDEISYYKYDFEGMEYCKHCSSEVKLGYTIAEENGISELLEKAGIKDYFNFEKYGDSFSYDYFLYENGYLIANYDLNLEFYTKDEIQEKIEEILNTKQKMKGDEVEIAI